MRAGTLWSKKEQECHINFLELLAITLALLTLNKMKLKTVHIKGDSLTTLSYFWKWGKKESATSNTFESDIGVAFQTSDHDNCRVPPRSTESSGLLGIKEPERFLRVKIISTYFHKRLSQGRTTRDRSICFSVVESTPSILLVETRSRQFGFRCTTAKVVPQASLCFLPFALIDRELRKIEWEHVSPLILVTPTWQSETWYPESLRLSMPSWNKWVSWCVIAGEKDNPFRYALKWILDFLSDLFEQGYKYRSVCSHRSAILVFHYGIERKRVGEHPQVSSLITRIFN